LLAALPAADGPLRQVLIGKTAVKAHDAASAGSGTRA